MSLCRRSFCLFSSAKSNVLSKRLFSHLGNIKPPPWKPHNIIYRGIRQQRNKRSLAPLEEIDAGVTASFRDLLKPFAATIMVSGVTFAGCSIWQYETMRSKIVTMKEKGHGIKQSVYGKAGSLRGQLNQYWNALTPGQQLTSCLIGVNTAIFLAWRVAPMRFMMKYFCSSPINQAPSTSMLLSTYSHYSMFHLFANMYVLWSFTPTITSLLGREQFFAMYTTAGMVSSFVSYANKVARVSVVPSLGASGAIIAVLGAVCSYYPDARLSIAFVDQLFPHSFSASSAQKAILVFDGLGLILGWRFFDHAAHLGGMLFGMWYVNYGHKYLWGGRQKFIKKWHDLRGPP